VIKILQKVRQEFAQHAVLGIIQVYLFGNVASTTEHCGQIEPVRLHGFSGPGSVLPEVATFDIATS
jgi:hypothetical protein